jgi:hypothetical protein
MPVSASGYSKGLPRTLDGYSVQFVCHKTNGFSTGTPHEENPSISVDSPRLLRPRLTVPHLRVFYSSWYGG